MKAAKRLPRPRGEVVELFEHQASTVEIKCAVCRARGLVKVLRVRLRARPGVSVPEGLESWQTCWFQVPEGWWLTSPFDLTAPHGRCPGCFAPLP